MKTAAKRVGTQAEAAEACGVSLRQFVKYLSGDTYPPNEVVTRLAEASGFSIEEFEFDATTTTKPNDTRGERIREMAETIGTQEEAATVAMVSPRQLRLYISGTSEPPVDVLERLAFASGFSLDFVLTGKGPRISGTVSALATPAEGQDFLRFQKEIYDQLRALYEEKGSQLSQLEAEELTLRTMLHVWGLTDDRARRTAVNAVLSAHSDALDVLRSEARGAKRDR